MSAERRIADLGLVLPPVRPPGAAYVNAVRTGNLVYLSGAGPVGADGDLPIGKVGADFTTEEATEHARAVALNLLAVLREEVGDLDRVTRVVKLLGMVNATPDFTEHPKVINACSELLVEVFGSGHARSAVGVGGLPFGMTVEIEAIFEVE